MFIDQPFQTTLCDKIQLEDIGLHSGRYVRAVICPAPANSGIKFRRIDVEDSMQTVLAHAEFATEARLCTRIENNDGVGLETIEHFMAAFAGLGVDNVTVDVDASEAPILDGSSKPLVEAINRVGLTVQAARRRHLVVTKPVEISLECGAWARIEPANQLEIKIEIDFEDAAIGKQNYHYRHGNGEFEAELAGARTFCQMRDVEFMQNAGLALGGSLNNAIVVENGAVLNDGGLRMENEFVRHKALDCLGDLYLLGMQIRGKLTSFRPGHSLSTKLVQALWHDSMAYEIIEDGVVMAGSEGYALPEVAAAAAV